MGQFITCKSLTSYGVTGILGDAKCGKFSTPYAGKLFTTVESKAEQCWQLIMPLAICRIQKIKNWGMLTGNEAHTARERNTPNANPEVANIRIIGDSSYQDLATLVRDKIGSQKIRSNAVLAVEMLLSASASYFRPDLPHQAGTYDKQCLDKFVEATINWLHSSWGERVLRAELHLDEITPHIHAYIVPLDERGKLNCRALFGGRIKLSQLQDSFGKAVAHLGISRGIKGSKATYTTLKKYYATVNQDSQLINLERFLPKTQVHETSEEYQQRVIQILNPEFEIINYQLNQRSRLLKQLTELKQTAIQSEKLRQQLESELQILTRTIKRQDLPLGLVAYELGVNQDNQLLSKTNAVDLVMKVNQCKFDDALIWLRDRFGEEQMLAAVTNQVTSKAQSIAHQNPKTAFVPPAPNKSRWKEVEKYFQNHYCIPQKLTQTLNQRGLLYADTSGNAVFLARNLSFEVTGAYLHSLKTIANAFSLYPGSKRSGGWFHLSMGRTSSSVWRWKQHSWATYQLPDGMKVMSVRQVARLVGQPNTDVIDFVHSNDLETINVRIPSKVVINAITLSSIAIYLRRLLKEDKLQHNRLSLCREEWEELIDALANPFFKEYLIPNPCFFTNNYPPVRANSIQIQLEDNITLVVLVLQTGEYRISCTEGLHCIQANPEWLMDTSPKKAKVFSKMKLSHRTVECRFATERGIRQAYTFGCDDWLSIWEYFARKGNKRAITVLKACAKENIPMRVEKVLSRSC